MNENVCRRCRRYAGRKEGVPARGWRCAQDADMTPSEVIPGHSFCRQDRLRPITEEMTEPPDWCEKPLEQLLLAPKAEVEARPDETLVQDGNKVAERRHREAEERLKDHKGGNFPW